MNSLVSIIIPVYNREHLIAETLNSVLSQSYKNWECIIIDDGSADKTEQVVLDFCKMDNRFSFYKRPNSKPKGANACRNYGFELSKGYYINWFDSDDLMHQDKLLIQIKTLEKSTKPFCVCESRVFSESITNILDENLKVITSENSFEDYVMKKIIFFITDPLFKKSLLQNYKFDEDLHGGQEWEFFSRILFDHNDYETINEPLVYLRAHDQNLSRGTGIKQLWNYFYARHKIYKHFHGQLSAKLEIYFRNYFLNIFKELIRNRHYEKSSFVWLKCLNKYKMLTFKNNTFIFFSYASFLIFQRGDIVLRKIV